MSEASLQHCPIQTCYKTVKVFSFSKRRFIQLGITRLYIWGWEDNFPGQKSTTYSPCTRTRKIGLACSLNFCRRWPCDAERDPQTSGWIFRRINIWFFSLKTLPSLLEAALGWLHALLFSFFLSFYKARHGNESKPTQFCGGVKCKEMHSSDRKGATDE